MTDPDGIRAELDATIEEIRAVDGFADFLAPPTFDDVSAAAEDRPLIYVAAADTGGFALAVIGEQITDVTLPELTTAALHEATGNYAYRQEAFRQSLADEHWREWSDALDRVTAWLWDAVLAPVIDHLAPDPGDVVTLVPCGPLALLPLHAAWTADPSTPTGRRYAADHAVWTYTANARALAACRAAAAGPVPRSSMVVADPEPDGDRALPAIATLSPLVKNLFPAGPGPLHGTDATRAAVAGAIRDADVLHLACHGRARLDEPLRSHLVLNDGELTLEEILSSRLTARLAVLAACETAMPGTDLPDEVVALPTGLVQAGVATVVAAMWACDELATALLLTEFYRLWPGLPAAVALAEAQRRLRDSTTEQMSARLATLPAETANYLIGAVEFAADAGERTRPWADIATWAAMTCTGA